ncbi:hypothetical protein SARC_16749, partial [Sphaeroforma arctica JP610]
MTVTFPTAERDRVCAPVAHMTLYFKPGYPPLNMNQIKHVSDAYYGASPQSYIQPFLPNADKVVLGVGT